jgi:hypothetical protein
MADTVTETEGTVDDHEKRNHRGSDNMMTEVTVTKRILANCEDTRQPFRFLAVGFSRIQSFFPKPVG